MLFIFKQNVCSCWKDNNLLNLEQGQLKPEMEKKQKIVTWTTVKLFIKI